VLRGVIRLQDRGGIGEKQEEEKSPTAKGMDLVNMKGVKGMCL
jgi:hypothetical protein